MDRKYIFAPAAVLLAALILVSLRSKGGNEFPESAISHAHGLAVDIEDSSRLYIPTHHGLLVLKNERDLFRIGASRDDLMGFSVHPRDPKIFFRSGHPAAGGNIGFQISEDGGVAWRTLSAGVNGPVDFHALAVSPVNPDLMYGWYGGALQRSQDGGRTWRIASRSVQAFQLAADPAEEGTVYANSGRDIWISKDRGETWKQAFEELSGTDVFSFAIDPKDPRKMLMFGSKFGGLARSADGGTTWERSSADFGGRRIFYIAFDPRDPSIIFALTDNSVLYKSTDGGAAWTRIF